MVRRTFCASLLTVVIAQTLYADLPGYVAKKDASYTWTKVASSEPNAPLQYAELHMISQVWRGTPWQHRLLVASPKGLTEASHALLIIGGGSWHEGLEKEPIKNDSTELKLAMAITMATKMPVIFVSHIPFQPLFDGKKEDQIISYTFDKFLTTGDAEWPLLLPMTKAAVRALDTTQAFASKEWHLGIKKFIVTGASKRGWTTWLTGAVDPRVVAIAPMVIDMLHLDVQMKHQKEVYGAYSEQVKDYTRLKIQDRMDSEAGKKLLSMVDPYSYRDRLTMPKLILLGTNDPYWTLDALNIYFDDLKGDKYVHYIPNVGHGLNDMSRLISDIAAFTLMGAGKLEYPKMTWKIEKDGDGYRFNITSDKKPVSLSMWHTTSETRDFRQSKWVSQAIQPNDSGTFTYELKKPEAGYAAAVGEALYEIDGHPLYLSTNVRMIGPEAPAK